MIEQRRSHLINLALSLALLGLPGCSGAEKAGAAPQLEVSVVEARQEDVVIFADFVGTIDGIENADIRARVPGYLEAVHFKEGSRVKKDDLLFTIDPVLSEAEVRKAQGDVATARASAAKSQADVERLTPLVATNAVSRQELDHATAEKQSADAQILAAQGALATAQANLSYTKVRSPIDGIIGVRQVSIGTLVGQAEPTLLTTVSQLDPVRVRFPISEQLYLKHAALLNRLVDGAKGESRLELTLADGSLYPERGWVSMLDRSVSISTGSIMLEARFPNTKGILRPGQFGRVRAAVDRVPNAIGVPQRAVIERQSMHELLVLGDGNKVTRRAVTVGPKVGNFWLIEKGLAAGDKVLVEGVQKVRPDMVVNPKLVKMDPISPPKEGTAPPIPPAGSAGSAEPAPSASSDAPKPAPKTPKK
jgi:membrane fusion protein (multidrug efflux system)